MVAIRWLFPCWQLQQTRSGGLIEGCGKKSKKSVLANLLMPCRCDARAGRGRAVGSVGGPSGGRRAAALSKSSELLLLLRTIIVARVSNNFPIHNGTLERVIVVVTDYHGNREIYREIMLLLSHLHGLFHSGLSIIQ